MEKFEHRSQGWLLAKMRIERANRVNANDRHPDLLVEILTRKTLLRHRNPLAITLEFNNESFNVRYFSNKCDKVETFRTK